MSTLHASSLKPQLSPLSESVPGRISSVDTSSMESSAVARNYSLVSRGGTRSTGGTGSKDGSGRGGPSANISGGPLSYTYTLTHARLHFGETDQQGSEHLLDNHAFPAEVRCTRAMLDHATPRHTTIMHATPRYTTQHNATLRYTTLHHDTPRHTTPRHTTQHYTALHHATPHRATPRCIDTGVYWVLHSPWVNIAVISVFLFAYVYKVRQHSM